jgi:hypothetical protein
MVADDFAGEERGKMTFFISRRYRTRVAID